MLAIKDNIDVCVESRIRPRLYQKSRVRNYILSYPQHTYGSKSMHAACVYSLLGGAQADRQALMTVSSSKHSFGSTSTSFASRPATFSCSTSLALLSSSFSSRSSVFSSVRPSTSLRSCWTLLPFSCSCTTRMERQRNAVDLARSKGLEFHKPNPAMLTTILDKSPWDSLKIWQVFANRSVFNTLKGHICAQWRPPSPLVNVASIKCTFSPQIQLW